MDIIFIYYLFICLRSNARAQVQNVLLRDTRDLYAYRVARLLGVAAHRVGLRMSTGASTASSTAATVPASVRPASTGNGRSASTAAGADLPSHASSPPSSLPPSSPVSLSVSSSVSASVHAVLRVCVAALRIVTRRDPNDALAREWADDCARRLPAPTTAPPPPPPPSTSVSAALHHQVWGCGCGKG